MESFLEMPMNRRHVLNAAAVAAAAGLVRRAVGLPLPAAKIEAVAFDGFAIFDPRPLAVLAEAEYPGKAVALMALWRARQFEYGWLRTLMRNYANFWQITQESLEFACASLELTLAADTRDRLMQSFLHLKPWPDVLPVLRRLRSAGIRLAFLSNLTAAMLDANMQGAGIAEFFDTRLSTDAVGAFKPDPRSYQMAVDHFALPAAAIAFVAFAGWDAAGATQFGLPVYWANRLAQPAEKLGAMPARSSPTLDELPDFVASYRSSV